MLVHCLSGVRSARAAKLLNELGYRDVVNLKAHLDMAAGRRGLEEPAPLLSPEQRRRYSRQVLIPEVGQEGQRRLLDAKVLLIGAGGLGSPIALYLTASGVGTIGLVDDDVVDESNLQRQILHGSDRVGMKKVESAELTLRGLNPETRVIKHEERLGADNVERLITDYDVIVDGTDNFDTLRAERRRGGSASRWCTARSIAGTARSTFIPFEGPCYRCMYPTQPPPELAPGCDVAGVLGVLPGIVGLLQANEVFKLLLGAGETLAGQLLFDAAGTTFDEVRIWRDPACPACGEEAADSVTSADAAEALAPSPVR